MKLKYILLALASLSIAEYAHAQGMHFSQYYNAPLLLNPANTALLPDADYQIGVNYRKQWAAIPVPYVTTSVYGHFQAMRNRNQTNWLGAGLAYWSDKAGNGDLSLSRIDASLAYHVQMGEFNMISAGVSAGSVQRRVDFNKLTFDRQWDGLQFDPSLQNDEKGYTSQTKFVDLAVGLNYAFFPNENLYLKVGLGVAHINRPKESFFGQENTLGMRPTGNVDVLLKLSPTVILNPSLYYTSQKAASQLVYGTLFQVNVSGTENINSSLIMGAYHRWNESVVGTIGIQYQHWRLMTSYDFTMSSLSSANKGRGAFELALKYEGFYGDFSRGRRSYNCPRF